MTTGEADWHSGAARGSVLPLVYSCSGASSAAQMANHLALRLDRIGVAEMSCIAGVGGDVKPLVRTAKSGRPIIAIDGCPLHCVESILARHGLVADRHYDLSEEGVNKRRHEDFSQAEAAMAFQRILEDPEFPGATPSVDGSVYKGSRGVAESACAGYASPPCAMPPIED